MGRSSRSRAAPSPTPCRLPGGMMSLLQVTVRRLLPVLALAAWVALPWLATAQSSAVEPPVMIVVDTPVDGEAVPSVLVLSGWALDPGHETSTGVDRVEVYFDGPRGSGTLLGTATY